jgi:hypothetical protein
MSSDSTSDGTSHGSGSISPHLTSVCALQPHQYHFSITSMMKARCPPAASPAAPVAALVPTRLTSPLSGRTSCGSGSHLPHLSSVPRCVRYNPISVTSMMQARIREMSSDSTSDSTSHGSRLTSPLCVHYNPINITSMMQARCPPTASPAAPVAALVPTRLASPLSLSPCVTTQSASLPCL